MLCEVLLKFIFCPSVAIKAKIAFKIIKESIKAADGVLDLYNSVMEQIIPWKEFNETIVELDKFRKDFSVDSALLIGEIKTLMLAGMDEYFSASQDIYE